MGGGEGSSAATELPLLPSGEATADRYEPVAVPQSQQVAPVASPSSRNRFLEPVLDAEDAVACEASAANGDEAIGTVEPVADGTTTINTVDRAPLVEEGALS